MENQFFLNGGLPHHAIHYETPQSHLPSMPTWHHHQLSSSSSSPAMEIQQQQQATVLNCSPDQTTQDCFYNPTEHHNNNNNNNNLNFDSALSSIVSSPSASNSNIQNGNFVIRELIGKLGGTIGSSGEISPHSQPLVYSTTTTPLSSPPKLNIPNLGVKPMSLNSSVAEFSADPGFAERAAKFSCFGSRSFNGRNNAELAQRSATAPTPPLSENAKIPRVSSSPSLKTLVGSQLDHNKNSSMEVANSQEDSTISEQTPNVEAALRPSPDLNSRKRKASSKGKAKDTSTPSNPTKGVEGSGDSNAKRSKPNECCEGNENNGSMKEEEDSKGGGSNAAGEDQKQNKNTKPPEPPKDYIHVRARRGQATDSHSLAERVRREKISERMKLLQDLVPGCNKVTGKALMLDEIINYVQSLQRQVEFLSMKLASVNTRVDLSIESLIPKDIFQSNHSLAHPMFPLDSSATAFYGHQSQQNQTIHNNLVNGNVSHSSVDPLDTSLCQNLGMQLPPLNGFNEIGSQYPLTFCEDDLNTIVQMGFGQTPNRKTPIQSPSFNGSNQVAQMKVEL